MEMEMEIGLKITQTREDMASCTLFKTDGSNHPPFTYAETDTMLHLIAHLSGFKKEQLKVEIDRTGTKIAISGEKWIQEMVMVRWQMHKKDPQISRFRRVFQIPDGIAADRINARFDELDSKLSIFMPKLKNGFQGIQIKDITHKEGHRELIGTSTPKEPMEDNVKQGIPKLPDEEGVEDMDKYETGSRDEVEEIEKYQEPFNTEEQEIHDSTNVGQVDEMKAAVSTNQSDDNLEKYSTEDYGAATEAGMKFPLSEAMEEKEKQPQGEETTKVIQEKEVKETDRLVGAESPKPSSEILHSPGAEIQEAAGVEKKTGVQEADISKSSMGIGPVEEDKCEALQRVEEEKHKGGLTGATDGAGRSSGRSHLGVCKPRCLIAGSAIIFSLVVAVIHLLKNRRSQREMRERQD